MLLESTLGLILLWCQNTTSDTNTGVFKIGAYKTCVAETIELTEVGVNILVLKLNDKERKAFESDLQVRGYVEAAALEVIFKVNGKI